MTEQKRILIAVMITSFIGPFMGSSVNIAVPAMAEDFNMMPDELTWAVTAFLIGSAATLLPFGRLADIKGRRRIYLQGLACICATTLVCAVVQNFLALIFVRFLQGLSMSMIFGTSMALLVSCCGAENRGKTIGLSAACVYSGVSLGPFIGGFITDYLGWRMIFGLFRRSFLWDATRLPGARFHASAARSSAALDTALYSSRGVAWAMVFRQSAASTCPVSI